MAKYFVTPNKDFPDNAHRFWLRKDQYTIGELFVDEGTAKWIAEQLGNSANMCRGVMHYYIEGVCAQCGSKEPTSS